LRLFARQCLLNPIGVIGKMPKIAIQGIARGSACCIEPYQFERDFDSYLPFRCGVERGFVIVVEEQFIVHVHLSGSVELN
ncbi:hypothetical protein P0D88_54085, partial [Paraburkholderia sp. RL18-103-BIB-C]|uniref:hypothetical protein n=1 Tax=unclassified Paraburkholderia TaxID=2615204 RepID=UPI0038BBD2D3